ncbi:MAG: hypothetical protein R2715_11410 [Ilumatobacteraceae bacterium]
MGRGHRGRRRDRRRSRGQDQALIRLQVRAAETPQETAIWSPDGQMAWAEAHDVVLRLAAAIRAEDLGESRRVAVVAKNRPGTVLAHARRSSPAPATCR